MKRTFADTFFFLALENPRDEAHQTALSASGQRAGRLVTTQWVLMEVADAFAAPGSRQRFLNLISALQSDPDVVIVPADDGLFQRGVELYRQRPDKDWPLTDCVSFVVMQDQDIREALTGDVHFEQAGFVALLAKK
jgi:predicted nucleic acid-binding protein